MLETAIIAQLLVHQGLSALVGDRVYPVGSVPQNEEMPYVEVQRASAPIKYGFSGSTTIVKPRIQIDSYASTYVDAKAVAAQVKAALQKTVGQMGSGQKTFTVMWCLLSNDMDLEEPNPVNPVSKIHRVMQDYRVMHQD